MTEAVIGNLTIFAWGLVISFALSRRRRAPKTIPLQLIDILPPPDPTALYVGGRIMADVKTTLLGQKLAGNDWTYQKVVTITVPEGKVKVTMEVEW